MDKQLDMDSELASDLGVGGEGSDDAALMGAIARARDRAAFARLFHRWAPKVKAHLMARGANAGVADELTQEVMLVVWRKGALFDPGKGSLGAWLYTVSRNCLLNQVRQRRARDGEIEVPEPADRPPTAEDKLIDVEQQRALARSIARLPPEQRDVLDGAYWRGQTLQEHADERAIPLGTVKTRVRLALARLRAHLGGGADGSEG